MGFCSRSFQGNLLAGGVAAETDENPLNRITKEKKPTKKFLPFGSILKQNPEMFKIEGKCSALAENS